MKKLNFRSGKRPYRGFVWLNIDWLLRHASLYLTSDKWLVLLRVDNVPGFWYSIWLKRSTRVRDPFLVRLAWYITDVLGINTRQDKDDCCVRFWLRFFFVELIVESYKEG